MLKELKNLRTIEQVRDGFVKALWREVAVYPELGAAFDLRPPKPDGPGVKSERRSHSERRAIEDIHQFVDTYLHELAARRQIYIVSPVEMDRSYRSAFEPGTLDKFIQDCVAFIVTIREVDAQTAELIREFLYSRLPLVQTVFRPAKVLQLILEQSPKFEQNWSFLFTAFLLFCILKKKIEVVVEHFYVTALPKEGVAEAALRARVEEDVATRFLKLLLNNARSKPELVDLLDVEQGAVEALIKEFQVPRINF